MVTLHSALLIQIDPVPAIIGADGIRHGQISEGIGEPKKPKAFQMGGIMPLICGRGGRRTADHAAVCDPLNCAI